jgi:hypothetical protein
VQLNSHSVRDLLILAMGDSLFFGTSLALVTAELASAAVSTEVALSTAKYVVLGLRQLAFALAFTATAVFYLRWNNAWFQQHAQEEFRLKQLELDFDRASCIPPTPSPPRYSGRRRSWSSPSPTGTGGFGWTASHSTSSRSLRKRSKISRSPAPRRDGRGLELRPVARRQRSAIPTSRSSSRRRR